MLRFASSLASKVRLPNNRINVVAGSRLSWSRDYVGDGEDIKFMSPCTEESFSINFETELDDTEIRKGVQMAIDSVLENLSHSAQMISTSEAIAQVATTSINGDKDIGALVARTIELVRRAEGHIFITEGKEPGVKLNLYSGFKLDWGYSLSCFVTKKKKKLCVFSHPHIYFFTEKLSDLNDVLSLLEIANPLLIIAEDFDDYLLDTIITRKLTAGTKVCAIKTNVPPDLFIPTDCLKAIVSENDTFIIKTRHTVEEIGQTRPDEVGGTSRADTSKKKSIVTHAVNAAKAAIEQGIVPGGGIAFLNASKVLDKLQTANSDQKIGIQIVQNALKMPVYTIAATAEVEGSVVGKLLGQDNPNLGYDATKGEYVDLIKEGILDPLKVIRKVFIGATSMFLNKLREGQLEDPERKHKKYKKKKKLDDVGIIQGKPII
ncbi:Chaperonin [Citrus sinensis]|uniref:Chaperonin n=1 Tax=Citrus sinensis TaxID=2711 RepID=A0ACB8MFH5_CITSI|nr:Chaperonin [Citrus sinensis]